MVEQQTLLKFHNIRQWNFMLSVRDALLHPPQIDWTELFDHSYIIGYLSIKISK